MNKEEFKKKWERGMYLGDSVYARLDENMIVLETINGLPDDPSNQIYLEPSVFSNLIEFESAIRKDIRKMNGWGEFENKEIE